MKLLTRLNHFRAVKLALESFQAKLSNERIRLFTDCQNIVRIVQYGSKNSTLQAEAFAIIICFVCE